MRLASSEIRDLAGDFAQRFLKPQASESDSRRTVAPEAMDELAASGFLGMLVSEDAFGLDLDMTDYLLVLEEFAREDASIAVAVGAHNGPVCGLLRRSASPEQRERWLPRLATGEVLGAFALAEPEAGSDAASLRCTAVPTDDGWALTGRKRWVTNGARAGLVVVFARTPAEGVSAFLVDTRSEGFSVARREVTLGLRALEVVELEFSELRLRSEALLGELGRGISLALGAIDIGRSGIAAIALGIGRAAAEHARGYAVEREQFGRRIAEFGATQAKFAEMATRLRAAELLVRDAAQAFGRAESTGDGVAPAGTPGVGGARSEVTLKAAMAKLAASETATWVADAAVQIYGGYGYMRHYPVERRLRDARGTELLGGSSEILRHVIARETVPAGAPQRRPAGSTLTPTGWG